MFQLNIRLYLSQSSNAVCDSSLLLTEIVVNCRRMYASTWLERLFQSCQRKSNKNSANDEQSSAKNSRLQNYEQLPNFGNDALVCEICKEMIVAIFHVDLVLGDMGMCTILCDE